jgi:hypothetical protein
MLAANSNCRLFFALRPRSIAMRIRPPTSSASSSLKAMPLPPLDKIRLLGRPRKDCELPRRRIGADSRRDRRNCAVKPQARISEAQARSMVDSQSQRRTMTTLANQTSGASSRAGAHGSIQNRLIPVRFPDGKLISLSPVLSVLSRISRSRRFDATGIALIPVPTLPCQKL